MRSWHNARGLLTVIAGVIILVLGGYPVSAVQYIAYSLKQAERRARAMGWRLSERDPQAFNLAGINRIVGVVYDKESGDVILVGQHVKGLPELTLDDVVVGLRAKMIYRQWPLVSIDPTSETEKTQMQVVRFEGGLTDTAFGRTLFEADLWLKKMSLGLVKSPLRALARLWDLKVRQVARGRVSGKRKISERFWFYPANPSVLVRGEVAVIHDFRIRVFTQVLEVWIDGKPVKDLNAFRDELADRFAQRVSKRLGKLGRRQEAIGRLAGLYSIVAVVEGLASMGAEEELAYWLKEYEPAKVPTPRKQKVLRNRYEGAGGYYEAWGGVHLIALAFRLEAGDVTELKEAVLKTRPGREALSWRFVVARWTIPIGAGQVKPEQIAPLFAQAVFLHEHKRYADAIALWDKIIAVKPGDEIASKAMVNKGFALEKLNRFEEAIAVYDELIRRFGKATEPDIREQVVMAMVSKGVTLGKLKRPQREIAVYDEVIHQFGEASEPGIREQVVMAMVNKGVTLLTLKRFEEAIAVSDEVIHQFREASKPSIRKRVAEAMVIKGWALLKLERFEEAIAVCDEVIHRFGEASEPGIRERVVKAMSIKSIILIGLERFEEEIVVYDELIRRFGDASEPGIREQVVRAMVNRGAALLLRERPQQAMTVCDEVIRRFREASEPGIREQVAKAMVIKGGALCLLERYGEARKAFKEAERLGISQARQMLELLRQEGHR